MFCDRISGSFLHFALHTFAVIFALITKYHVCLRRAAWLQTSGSGGGDANPVCKSIEEFKIRPGDSEQVVNFKHGETIRARSFENIIERWKNQRT